MADPADRSGRDVLAGDWRRLPRARTAEVAAVAGLVVEDVGTGFCGAVVGCDKYGVILQDRHGTRRLFQLGPGFLLEGRPVALTRPTTRPGAVRARSASGSLVVDGLRARVARESRIYVEGRHDAELVEQVWGHDLRVEGVVVEELGGVDDLPAIVAAFRPGPGRRLGVLVDHLVPGSKETRIAAAVARGPGSGQVLVAGHPYVDVWQGVRPAVLGIQAWPQVPAGLPWKEEVVARLGWRGYSTAQAWSRILAAVRTYADLEPPLLARVEEVIDFVTAASGPAAAPDRPPVDGRDRRAAGPR